MKFSGSPNFLALDAGGRTIELRRAAEALAALGSDRVPSAPQGIVAQSGARKAVLTWEKPTVNFDIVGYRIYKDTEASMVATVDSKDVLRYELPLSSGAIPPATNIFVSSVNAAGKESNRVQVQCTSIVEAAAPSDPPPPAGGTTRIPNSKLDYY